MSDTPADREHCRAVRANGEPCKGRPLAGGLCFAHQPSAQANRAKGGHARSNAARSMKAIPERLRPVAELLASALQEVHAGTLAPTQATAMASVASALVKVMMAGDLEERMRALEAALSGERSASA